MESTELAAVRRANDRRRRACEREIDAWSALLHRIEDFAQSVERERNARKAISGLDDHSTPRNVNQVIPVIASGIQAERTEVGGRSTEGGVLINLGIDM